MLDVFENIGVLGFCEVIEAFVEQYQMLLGESAGGAGPETRKAGFF